MSLRSWLTSLAFAAATVAWAEPSVDWQRDPITDNQTTSINIDGTWHAKESFEKPRLSITCRFYDNSDWQTEPKKGYQTTIFVDLPGSKNWRGRNEGLARLDDAKPFSVDVRFLRSFEGFSLNLSEKELAAASKLAIQVDDITAVFDLIGLRDALVNSPNKCNWHTLRLPEIDEV